MKIIVICFILSILTIATVQAQRLSFEPELGFRLQHSKVENIFHSTFVGGTSSLASNYKAFWRTDPNLSICLNAKIKNRWSFTTGFQYFKYYDYIYHLENQPWPVGWKDKFLVNKDRILGLKFAFRYDLFKKTEAKWGASVEMGIKYLIRQKTKFVFSQDTFASVANGYNAQYVYFYSTERQYPFHKNGIINEYFTYLSFKPFYKINNRLKIIGSIDFNLNMDIIVLSNFDAQVGHSIGTYYSDNNTANPRTGPYSNTLMDYAWNQNSWNFSLGVQIPLIKDKVKKPKIDPALMEGY